MLDPLLVSTLCVSFSMYIMCVILCLFSALSRRVGVLQIAIITIIIITDQDVDFRHACSHPKIHSPATSCYTLVYCPQSAAPVFISPVYLCSLLTHRSTSPHYSLIGLRLLATHSSVYLSTLFTHRSTSPHYSLIGLPLHTTHSSVYLSTLLTHRSTSPRYSLTGLPLLATHSPVYLCSPVSLCSLLTHRSTSARYSLTGLPLLTGLHLALEPPPLSTSGIGTPSTVPGTHQWSVTSHDSPCW